ncbi:MAG: flagellin [Limnohabitans sp.]
MSVINTNVSSLKSQNSLQLNESKLSKAMERLSTGVRINSARDDAAGLAITTRMTSEIRGLTQAVRNANDGISVAQTAEGALGEITNILQRLREIAVQSANSTNNGVDRSFLNTEAQQLIDETQRIGGQTSFNGIRLLDGTFTSKDFQVGAGKGETITFNSIADSKASALGSNILVMNSTSTTAGTGALTAGTAAATLPVNGVVANTTMTLSTASGGKTGAITTVISSSAKGIADAINAAAAPIGVTAVATNAATIKDLNTAGTVTFNLTGTASSASAISAVVTTTSDLTSLAAAINGVSADTGITATFADPAVKSSIQLTSKDGSNIGIADFSVTVAGTLSTTATVKMGDGPAAIGGGGAADLTLTSGQATDSGLKTGIVTLNSAKGAITMANTETTQSAASASTFNSILSVDLSTQTGSQDALTVIDNALTQVNNTRANLGGLMNRFEAAISNQGTAIANLSASRSRILDTDYAVETTNLAKAQIIQQAATAMLAQANQSSQSVLALLK